MIFSNGWGQSCPSPCPFFTPRLGEFGLIWAIHSISLLSMSHCKYNEWFFKVEIWIQQVYPSPHPGFWVLGGDNFGSSTLHFTPRCSIFGWIQEAHSITTLPTSHYKYNEWLEKVEIGICIWALKWLPQCDFLSNGWGQSCPSPCPIFTPRLSEFGLIWAIHCISLLSMSHYKYNE